MENITQQPPEQSQTKKNIFGSELLSILRDLLDLIADFKRHMTHKNALRNVFPLFLKRHPSFLVSPFWIQRSLDTFWLVSSLSIACFL